MHLISTGQACKLFGISKRTLYNWRNLGKIPEPIICGGGPRRPLYMWDLQGYAKQHGLDLSDLLIRMAQCSTKTNS